jgi:hypothetical protein
MRRYHRPDTDSGRVKLATIRCDRPPVSVVGTIAAARRSLAEWSTRHQRAVCVFCGN